MNAPTRKQRPHVFAALIALGVAAIILFAAQRILIHVEHTTIASTAPESFGLKNQGLAFQRAAAHSPNVLPIYGSSELLQPAASERGDNFFRTAPTGFQLSPVGGEGATPLAMLQRVAALDSDLRGKKLAVSLSPGWFFSVKPGWSAYAGNFSPMAASEMIFGTVLDFHLKRKIASRMLDYSSLLENRPLLEFALRCLASGRRVDRILFYGLWPAGKMQNVLLELLDHLAALDYFRHEMKAPPRLHAEAVDWRKLIAKVSETAAAEGDEVKKTSSSDSQIIASPGDAAFRADMNTSPAWIDLELLLHTLASVHARPLILSMPIPRDFYKYGDVSRAAREDYYRKLHALVQRYHFAVVEFEGHDEDWAFLLRHSSHLTVKGWVYYDRALDDFFHDRVPES